MSMAETVPKVTVPVGVGEFGSMSTVWSGGQPLITGAVVSTVGNKRDKAYVRF